MSYLPGEEIFFLTFNLESALPIAVHARCCGEIIRLTIIPNGNMIVLAMEQNAFISE